MKTKRILNFFIITVLAIVAAGCKDDPVFKLSGTVAGDKDITIRLVMYAPDGVKKEILASRSGHFEYGGPAPADGSPVYFEFYSNDYAFLGAAAIGRDETANVTVDPVSVKGFRADGNAFNRSISDFLSSAAAISNDEIARFVRANPGEPSSYVILTTLYDASVDADGARVLLDVLKPTARPAYYVNGFVEQLMAADPEEVGRVAPFSILTDADTIRYFNPADYRATLIAFSDDETTARTDSVVPMLRTLSKPGRRALVIDHSLVTDTLTWKRTLRADTCTWTSVWSGAGPASPGVHRYAISRLPYFVVADSAGVTVYRGTSASAAETEFRKLLKP